MITNIQVRLGLILGEMYSRLSDVRDREEGQGLVEYGLILALVAVIAVAALTLLGGNISKTLSGVASKL